MIINWDDRWFIALEPNVINESNKEQELDIKKH